MADEWRILRERQAALARDLDQLNVAPQGTRAELVQVYQQVAIPTAAGKYFAAHPVTPGGAEVEGGAGTFTADSGTIFVLVVGGRVPVAGDYLIAKPIGGRWVARSRGSGSCTFTLTVHGCNGTSLGGKVITLKQSGVTKATCTTGDGTGGTVLGRCIVSIPAGTYDVSIPAGDNYAAFSGTLTQACPGGGSSTFNLSPAAGYVCDSCCNVPVPITLSVSDGEGTHTLTYVGSGLWECVYTPSVTSYDIVIGVGCSPVGSMTVQILYSCPQLLTITWTTRTCGPPGGDFQRYNSGAWNSGVGTATSSAIASSHSCSPFSATFNMPVKDPSVGLGIPDIRAEGRFTPGGGGAMTVTP